MNHPALIRVLLCLVAGGCAFASSAQDKKATPAQAIAMVKKAVGTIRKDGPQKAYAEITDRRGDFVIGDLYITVWGMDGTVRAHGANSNMVGKNLIDLKDI